MNPIELFEQHMTKLREMIHFQYTFTSLGHFSEMILLLQGYNGTNDIHKDACLKVYLLSLILSLLVR